MYINKELLHSDYEDYQTHLKAIVKQALNKMEHLNGILKLDYYDALDTLKCINDFCELHNIKGLNINADTMPNNARILSILRAYYTNNIFNNSSNSFKHHFESKKYEFTEDEYTNIQDTINALRTEITASKIFGEDHQERLLSRLEELQKELHKKMNKLDKALGQLVSIGTSIGAFGEKSKPMFDIVNETIKTVLRIQQKGDKVALPENQLGCEAIIEAELIENSSSDTASADV